jgi:hypothetical protein
LLFFVLQLFMGMGFPPLVKAVSGGGGKAVVLGCAAQIQPKLQYDDLRCTTTVMVCSETLAQKKAAAHHNTV